MDSMAEINAPLTESEDLCLSSNHPGLHDAEYVRRRKMFFYFARDLRLRKLPSPCVPYTEEESNLWSALYDRLSTLHDSHAAGIFLTGKKLLGLSRGEIPQLPNLERLLYPRTGIRLVPAEGLLHGKSYFSYWAERIMPCTLFLRHPRQPEYTPEPDNIHDVIGHVPPLMDSKYVELIRLIGTIARTASPENLERLVRFYWFTVEFGLLDEGDRQKVLGAGILSSIGEMQYVCDGKAEIRRFDLEEVLNTPFDPTTLQPVLFVAPSLEAIIADAHGLAARMLPV